MTVKEAMTKVSEDRETFPMGWNTEMKEVYAKSGGELYERRQRRVWLLVSVDNDAHEPDAIAVFHTEAKAKEAMEREIADALEAGVPCTDPSDLLNRESDREVTLGEGKSWTIKPTQLIA